MKHDERASREEARPLSEADVLIERMIDGEAGLAERAQFRRLAAADRRLWRQLAERQQELIDLTGAFEAELAAIDRIELPDLEREDRRVGRGTGRWTNGWIQGWKARWIMGAAAGWAAALIMAAIWIFPSAPSPEVPQEGQAVRTRTSSPPPEPSPDEHLAAYLAAPNVLGELEPVVLEVEELSDGRTVVRYLRRIEEFAFVPSGDPLPVTDRGRLTVDPADLRHTVPQRRNAD